MKFLLILLVLLLPACAPTAPPHIQVAAELCANHGGVAWLDPNWFPTNRLDVKCGDGTFWARYNMGVRN